MIQSSAPIWQVNLWKKALADAIKDPRELFDILNLPHRYLVVAQEVTRTFPLRVTRGFVARMRRGDINDPLLLQVLPLHLENQLVAGYNTDPVGDGPASTRPGVIHKYYGRVLLVTTGACAVHCRYCFRRHFPYSQANPAADDWNSAVQYIAGDASISEVILSGGDPLSLSDQKLRRLTSLLAQIPHITTLRIHSRVPVVLPERINDTLLENLTASRLQTVMVVHANHAHEINDDVAAALEIMRKYRMPLLNQSVLLRKINDSADALANLSKTLFAHGVMPYYLHTLDTVQGAAHFAVTQQRRQEIYRDLSRQLPGYLLPKLVTDQAGADFKIQAFHSQDQYDQ